MPARKFIVHADMDAFFAAIEQRDNPQYRSKPVVVGADPKGGKGRGVVSTASYEARRFGIHSAMPISIAYNKCPRAVFLPVDMEKYSRVSGQIYKILYNFTPDIEPVSIDEAFMDVTGSVRLFGAPPEICRLIKRRINDETGLTASLGLAPTKMAAKIASDLKKPDGMVEVAPEGLLDFLWPLEVGRIWGLGDKSEAVLKDMGIATIGELAKRDIMELAGLFGKMGAHFWQLANGIDEREVETDTEIKSISNEITFDKDTLDKEKIESSFILLCEKVSGRLRHEGFKGRTVTLKLRLRDFKTYTRALTLDRSTNFFDTIYKEIKILYANFNNKTELVRLIGVKVSGLVPADFEDSLFKNISDIKSEALHSAVDSIRKRFGDGAIYRAGNEQKSLV